MIDESKRWPESFPDRWASEWGEDETERERWRENEIQHQVTLSEGFWFGATTVTQELWQAVTRENPSRFQGEPQPLG